MAHEHHFCPRFRRCLNGWQGGSQAGVTGDAAMFDGHIQIFTDQHALSFQGKVSHLFHVHVSGFLVFMPLS